MRFTLLTPTIGDQSRNLPLFTPAHGGISVYEGAYVSTRNLDEQVEMAPLAV